MHNTVSRSTKLLVDLSRNSMFRFVPADDLRKRLHVSGHGQTQKQSFGRRIYLNKFDDLRDGYARRFQSA